MLLGTVSGVLFALGMCMALIPEWEAFQPGVILGCIGLITLIVWRRMEHKAPIKISGKTIFTIIVGIVGALALGVGMCFSMVWGRMIIGIAASVSTDCFVMKLSGILLAVLSFVLTGVVYISLSQNTASRYGEIIMITIATYTFCKITLAIIKAVKQRKNPSRLLAVIRNIRYAEAAVSVLTLQGSMLASFGTMSDKKAHIMNVLTGAAVCLFVLILGIAMVIKSGSQKFIKK